MKSCSACNLNHVKRSAFCSKACKDDAWYQANKDRKKQYYINNIEHIKTREHSDYIKNKDIIAEYNRVYYAKNSEKIKLEKKLYSKQNRNKINTYNSQYYSDVNHKLAKNLRGRLSCAIRRNLDGSRGGSFVRDLGCSIEDFKSFIENKWTQGMNWNNYGWGNDKWHLDHITPLAKFDLSDPEQFKIAAHYANYQPLWQPDNFKKGAK